MPSVYKLSKEGESLRDLLREDLTDKERDAVLARHRELTDIDLPAKFENCAKFIKNNEALAKALKEEANRLAARAKTVTRAVDWVKEDTKGWIEASGLTEYRAGIFTLRVAKCGGKQAVAFDECVDLDRIPDEFVKTIPERRELDTDALRRAIAAGRPVPCKTVERSIINGRLFVAALTKPKPLARELPRGTRLSIR